MYIYVCMHMFKCPNHVCIYSIYVYLLCMYVYVCMYACMYIYICMHACQKRRTRPIIVVFVEPLKVIVRHRLRLFEPEQRNVCEAPIP